MGSKNIFWNINQVTKKKIKENIDLLTIILADKEFKKANLIDLRQENQIIINEQ